MNQPVTGAVPQDNRDYQMISPTVATFSVGTSTLTPRILLTEPGVGYRLTPEDER